MHFFRLAFNGTVMITKICNKDTQTKRLTPPAHQNVCEPGGDTCSVNVRSQQLEPVHEEIIVPQSIRDFRACRVKSQEASVQFPSISDSLSARGVCGREKNSQVTSYGGTFHVSKDIVPMPSPCTVCKQ